MSGIYISRMEMPSGCPYCLLSHWEHNKFMGCEAVIGKGRAVLTDKKYAESPASSRPDWCPLIPVPDHGRLIEEHEAVLAFYSVYQEHGLPWYNAEVILEKCKTILPSG